LFYNDLFFKQQVQNLIIDQRGGFLLPRSLRAKETRFFATGGAPVAALSACDQSR
jgi:hypothetical protein